MGCGVRVRGIAELGDRVNPVGTVEFLVHLVAGGGCVAATYLRLVL
jgi:hypothetical protein